MIKVAEKTTVVFQVAIDGIREAVGVNVIAVGLIVLFVAWIVDQQSIGSGRTTNDNAIHGVGLMFRAFEVSVFFIMEVAEREEWNPSALIMAHAMNK
jgi:hypothetical protein